MTRLAYMVKPSDLPHVFNCALAEGACIMIKETLERNGVKPNNPQYRKICNVIYHINEAAMMFAGHLSDTHYNLIAATLQRVESTVKAMEENIKGIAEHG